MIDEVATKNTEGETLNSRLQLFLFSLFPSLEGVFGSKEELMAARAVVPQRQLRIRGVFLLLISTLFSLISIPLVKWHHFLFPNWG